MLQRKFGTFLVNHVIDNQINITQQAEDKGRVCRSVLAALPHWFGIESAVDNYVVQAERQVMFAAFEGDKPIGMVTLEHHSAWNLEVAAMGVLPEFHRSGIGRQLMTAVEDYAKQEGIKALTVKTLSSSNPDEGYKKTRAFYQGVGFELFEEMPDLWDEENPAVMFIKPLR